MERRFVLSETGILNQGGEPSGKASISFANRQVEYMIHPDKRRVVVRFGKKLTAKDIEQYTKRLRNDPDFQPEFSEIADISEAEEIDLQADDFLRLADEIDPFSPDAKRAFVVQTSTQSHAARMHKILRSNKNIEIFDSFYEAEEWVQL